MPRLKEFKGERSTKEVDNFLWSMEQYFGALGVYNDASKVRTASMYLVDIVMLWWRRRCEEARCDGRTILTWNKFVAKFKQQFFPEHAKDEARAKFRWLVHKQGICDYVKEFTELMLEMPDMDEADAFFSIMDGLKLRAKLELQ